MTCTVLLTLPGSALPREDWLDKVYFDKWVHIFLFAIMTWLGCLSVMAASVPQKWNSGFLWVAIACLLYGIVMEFVQDYWIPRRSFDLGDIVADGAGSWGGWFFSAKRYIKNKPL